MICISVQTAKIDNSRIDTRTFYKCPKCLTPATYFIVPPDVCSNCGYKFPDLKRMEKDQGVRYNYYIFGKY